MFPVNRNYSMITTTYPNYKFVVFAYYRCVTHQEKINNSKNDTVEIRSKGQILTLIYNFMTFSLNFENKKKIPCCLSTWVN